MTNFSSQLFTLFNEGAEPLQRLTFFTGKGGVGKTLLSLSYTKSLIDNGYNAKYISFKNDFEQNLAKEMSIPTISLNLDESAKYYIELKLKSKKIAQWISDSSFFKAIFHILPSFEDLILLGHIIYELREKPSLYYVVDTPSSGHAFSLFESLNLWKKIFVTGALIKDIEMMRNFISNKSLTKIYIVSIMSELSLQEAAELQDFITKQHIHSELLFNDLYSLSDEILSTREKLPNFLNHKTHFEQNVLMESRSSIIPHIFALDQQTVVNSISKVISNAKH